ncbi:unnamed protein product [Chilo suppressalis]|uniref:Uncharacterized protein n=1 Tax=Chilo suppressalis TaxID=168631 RepID=A0ABN8AT95_CHISP|nr:unnamed protein product [Chilo suppressalis]
MQEHARVCTCILTDFSSIRRRCAALRPDAPPIFIQCRFFGSCLMGRMEVFMNVNHEHGRNGRFVEWWKLSRSDLALLGPFALKDSFVLIQISERVIHERGCLAAGEDWLQRHCAPVSAALLGPLALKSFDIAKIIYDKGCLEAAEEWFDHNLLIVATSAVCTAFAQILGICFAQNLRADIFAQKAKWH